MKKIVPLIVLCLTALLAYGCEKMSQDEHQEFVMTTPDVGNLTFAEKTAQQVNDREYFVCARTKWSEDDSAHDKLQLALIFDKDTGIGKRITVNYCSFGPYNVNDLMTDELSGGRIYLKNVTERNIILRFKNVRFTTDWGEYGLNGDLTFAMSHTLLYY